MLPDLSEIIQPAGTGILNSVLNTRLFFFFFFLPFLGPLPQHGGSQARGLIGAIATGLHQSHSNAGSKLRLRPTHSSGQRQILNPLSKTRD